MTYAATTSVPVERSRAEIERILTRFGASRFASGWDQKGAAIAFEAGGRHVRFVLPMPDPQDKAFRIDKRGFLRTDSARQGLYDQSCRQRWRALALCIKAKLEAVESGISTFEAEFLSHVILPSGVTVGDWIGPQIGDAYATGAMPPLLGMGSS